MTDNHRLLVSDSTLAEIAAMEERDRLAGGPPWVVPDHPDHSLPGGWHRNLGTAWPDEPESDGMSHLYDCCPAAPTEPHTPGCPRSEIFR